MDNNDWDESIRKNFSFLFEEYGFQVISSTYSPKHFGNRLTILESDEIKILIALERSKVLIEIISKHDPLLKKYLKILVDFLRDDPAIEIDIFKSLVSLEDKFLQLEKSGRKFKDNAKEIFKLYDKQNIHESKKQLEDFRKRVAQEYRNKKKIQRNSKD